MKQATVIICFFTLPILLGCSSREREEKLQLRQKALDVREQELLLKENTLKLKEEELNKREKKLDSISVTDSIAIINNNPDITGTWQVTMTCIETNCQGSAVGDTKTEQWHMRYQDNHVVAEAHANNKLVRVYSGTATENRMELIEHRDTSLMTYDTRMVVRLTIKDKKTIEGHREIIRQNDCKIVYSLLMNKQ